ncbi:MAG: YfiT family bacillithiol transferase [Bacteroidia bacterium]
MEHLKYPIGKHIGSETYTKEQIAEKINDLKVLPENLKNLVSGLSETELAKTYREGSWTIKQLVHHIGESHINCYIRLKLALTEDNPTIRPYIEDLWVKTKENDILDISVSISIIENIHLKLVTLLETLSETELSRTFFHPQYQRTSRITDLISLYSWHGRHHIAHIGLALGN